MVDSENKLFISHSSKDGELARNLTTLLASGIGIPLDSIFCTSENNSIMLGSNFNAIIKEQLTKAKIVLIILTENYENSKYCLCEFGAAWVLNKNIMPILGTDCTLDDLNVIVKTMQISKVNSIDGLNTLRDNIQNITNTKSNTSRWETERDKFLNIFSTLENDISTNISLADFPTLSALINRYNLENANKISFLADLENVEALKRFFSAVPQYHQYYLRKEEAIENEFKTFRKVMNKK